MNAVEYAHVEVASDGTALIAGTTIKVIDIALDRIAYRWDADEMHRQHPHLSLGQIHSALAYYYDHQDELDQIITERSAVAEDILAAVGISALRKKLQAHKASRGTA